MPLSHLQTQALPGNSSNSRKRTHAEITRSESRSQSPHPPSKRRRTIASPPTHYSPTPPDSQSRSQSQSQLQSPLSVRFTGDGFDYRRPIMSNILDSGAHDQDTIDLTLDEDSPPPPQNSSSTNTGRLHSPLLQNARRAPPFAPYDHGQPQPVIDLSSDDEDDYRSQTDGGTRLAPTSPEVEFMGERPLPQLPQDNNTFRRRPQLPPPPGLGHFGSVASFLDLTQNMLANFRGARELPEDALNRIDGLFTYPAMGRGGPEQPADVIFDDEYEGLQMDYARTAFNIGADMFQNIQLAPMNRANESSYKEPPPAKEGYTRNYEEDDMLICSLCGDELATGPTDQKQQVWIAKQCGHAYCGDCAHSRNVSKQKTAKDSKRTTAKKPSGFRVCAIPDCKKAVDSKTKMFQIYL